MRINLTTLFRTVSVGALLAILSSCAGPGGLSSDAESVVKARADQRWQLLIAGKLDDAYQMLSPGYRAVNSVEAYKDKLSPAVKWLSAEAVSVTCETKDACVAKVKLEAKPIVPPSFRAGNIVTYLEENWILVDRQWWHFPNR